MRQIVCRPVISLLLAITPILASNRLSAKVQGPLQVPGTPQLIFSTYLGGSTACDSCTDVRTYAQNAASDAQGNTYVTGATTVKDLHVLNAFQPTPAANSTLTAFVAKYDPAGNILWLTYLGGNNETTGIGIAAMPDGGVAVAGLTGSDDPVPSPTKHAFQDKYAGKADYFVSVFDANGALRYSSYLGGSDVEGSPGNIYGDNGSNGNIIATDEHGLVYVTGTTGSGGSGGKTFPVTGNAVQPVFAGGTDSFLTIVDPAKSGADSLVYSSFLGGKGHDKGHSIVVNSGGELITASGYTSSTNFPTINGYRDSPPKDGFSSNGFVTQFRSSKPGDPSSEYTMLYSTYLGADSTDARDDVYGTALDPNGLVLATGRTRSADFPMTGPGVPFLFNSAPYLQPGAAGDQPFLVKIDPSLHGNASLVYSTFLGGSSKGFGSFCTGVGADAQGKAYVAGETNAPGVLYTPFPAPPSVFVASPTHFPYTADALITTLQGEGDDAEFMQVTADGGQLGYSTYLGRTKTDRAYGLAVDPTGNVVVTGITSSRDFPLKNAVQPQWPGGTENAFVTKFSFASVTAGGNR